MENVNEQKETNETKETNVKGNKQSKTKSKPKQTTTESKPEQTKTESKPDETEPKWTPVEHEDIEDISEDVFYEKGLYTPKTNAEIFSEMAKELTDSINSRRPEAAKKSSGLTLKSVASMAATAIPVVAGILYIKDRKKVNSDTASAFMNMGNGNF